MVEIAFVLNTGIISKTHSFIISIDYTFVNLLKSRMQNTLFEFSRRAISVVEN